MFKLLNDGTLLNLAWLDTFEVIDATIKYVLVNGHEIIEEYPSHEDAVEASKDIGKLPEEFQDVNDVEF